METFEKVMMWGYYNMIDNSSYNRAKSDSEKQSNIQGFHLHMIHDDGKKQKIEAIV